MRRKRNSVNPPLIRYNGSLVVCPVRTRPPPVYDTGAPDTLTPAAHLYRSRQRRRDMAVVAVVVVTRCGTAVELEQPVNLERLGPNVY